MLKPVVGFAAFGLFWGAWGAILPAVRSGAGVTDGELGVALLMVGVGALISMRFTGHLIDRYGGAVLPVVTVLFGICGVLPALANSAVTLSAALLLLGATSGATDVAINATGSHAEAAAGRPVLNLAHGLFSVAVVVASLSTAGLRAAGVDALPVLGGTGFVIVLAAVIALRPDGSHPVIAPESDGPASDRPAKRRLEPTLIVFGGLCALAYLVENAWQSWGAVHLDTSLHAAAGLASSAPAVFAAAAAAGRFSGNGLLKRVRPVRLLVAGGAIAAVGSLCAALATNPWVALAGIAVAGLGTSVCAPTIIGMAGAWAGPERRAGAISVVTTIAYLGFLVGPAAVGAVSSVWSLSIALAGVAVIASVVAGLAPVAGRVADGRAALRRTAKGI
ncbi:MFS transporter [Kribbella kalugense]|uniref:MFS transporter n=1 Tax=Kribbella kalugense TaxID=2512221 RepID=A0A4R7ZRD3_9ACTN|nr:MFS transporter [Kribbella kalugense]TDW19218.1 MFS transporter [Kribbella kalugense]